MLENKKIVLGVTGGIAAYKSVEIASRLKKAGAEVHVVMTRGAENFITPLTFREITGHSVTDTMWADVQEYNVEHIALAKMADLVLIAPATANFIAKAACGMADDMLTTMLLATDAPVVMAPAMNTAMYENPVTQENIRKLVSRGWIEIRPASGNLACGSSGVGRLPEPNQIVDEVQELFKERTSLSGRHVLVTAAGTIEPIDPVRYIGNRSSGKMGYAVALEAARRGAIVSLISGPSALPDPIGVSEVVRIESAKEMRDAVMDRFDSADIVIKAAAVADYHAKNVSEHKIKKDDDTLTLVLEKNPDILMELGKKKRNDQILVGFAAETRNLLEYARHKLEKKNLDLIVANDVTRRGAGFNTDTNIVRFLGRDGSVEELPMMLKSKLAGLLLDRVEEILEKKNHADYKKVHI